MSITNKGTGAGVQVLEGEHSLPKETPCQLFSEEELEVLEQERLALLDQQMPSFIRGDEDEGAEELFYLPLQITSPG
ncbi:MAG: hypothetical protein VKM34_09660 [Cyanobacteriota bacterium]|nr:hypothetical protein [Cyanobacteriota bacterium]